MGPRGDPQGWEGRRAAFPEGLSLLGTFGGRQEASRARRTCGHVRPLGRGRWDYSLGLRRKTPFTGWLFCLEDSWDEKPLSGSLLGPGARHPLGIARQAVVWVMELRLTPALVGGTPFSPAPTSVAF